VQRANQRLDPGSQTPALQLRHQHRLSQHRELGAHSQVGGQVAVADSRADPQAILDWYVPRQGPEFETWLDQLDAVAARIAAEKMFTFSVES